MLNSKALEMATDEIAVYIKKEARAEMARAVVAAYLTASMPEDVKAAERIKITWRDGAYYVDRANWNGGEVVMASDHATALASLSAKVDYWRGLHDERTRMLGDAEASIAERDRIIAEIVAAWERLPEGRYTADAVQDWLLRNMKPAIDAARDRRAS